MKLILSAILMLAAAPALAASDYSRGFDGSSSGDFVVFYASWCVENQVAYQDVSGQVVIRENCAKEGLTCRDVEQYRGRQYVHSAMCVQD